MHKQYSIVLYNHYTRVEKVSSCLVCGTTKSGMNSQTNAGLLAPDKHDTYLTANTCEEPHKILPLGSHKIGAALR